MRGKRKLLLIILLSTILSAVSITPAYAAEDESTFLDTMLDSVFSGLDGESSDSYFAPSNLLTEGNNLIYKALDAITNTKSGVGKLYTLFKGFSVLLMTMYFVMSLTSMDYSRQFGKPTMEMLAKPFAKFIICMLFVIFAEQILKFAFALSAKAFMTAENLDLTMGIETKKTLAGDVGQYKKAIYDAAGYTMAADKAGFGIVDTFKNIPAFLSITLAFIVPWLISMAADLVTAWVVYSRTVNIIVRTVAAPLALHDLYSERSFRETKAFNFIKEYTGLCFQSVVIIIIMAAMSIIFGVLIKELDAAGSWNTFKELQGLGLKIAVFKLVQVGVIVGSANTAKKLMGAM